MFGSKKVSGEAQLRAVYADQSDGELLRLHAGLDALTDTAREALTAVMKERGLEPTAAPAGSVSHREESPASRDADLTQELAPDERELYTFSDTYQLSEMVRLLEEANIPLRLIDHSEVQWAGLRSRRRIGMTLVVERRHELEAGACLRQVLRLEPGSYADRTADLGLTPPTDLTLLTSCDRATASGIAQALAKAGISYLWRDGQDDEQIPGDDTVALEVRAGRREQADMVVQAWIRSLPDTDDANTEEAWQSTSPQDASKDFI